MSVLQNGHYFVAGITYLSSVLVRAKMKHVVARGRGPYMVVVRIP
jgi:hypothetical protein